MIEDTIALIETKIQKLRSVEEAKKAEMLELLSSLQSETRKLSKTHAEHAESIARFAEISAHEATRETQNPELLQLSVEGLSSSVTEFEATHPRLVEVVNSICVTLSSLGI